MAARPPDTAWPQYATINYMSAAGCNQDLRQICSARLYHRRAVHHKRGRDNCKLRKERRLDATTTAAATPKFLHRITNSQVANSKLIITRTNPRANATLVGPPCLNWSTRTSNNGPDQDELEEQPHGLGCKRKIVQNKKLQIIPTPII